MQRVFSRVARATLRASKSRSTAIVSSKMPSASSSSLVALRSSLPLSSSSTRSFHASVYRMNDAEKTEEKPTTEGESKEETSTEELLKQLKEKEEALEAKETEAKEMHAKYMRALAEIENVRRIARDDVRKAEEYAIAGFAKNLLEVADSLGMALQQLDPEKITQTEVDMMKTMHDGISMVDKILISTFER